MKLKDVREENSGGTSGGRPTEGDTELAEDEHLIEPLKITINWLRSDEDEGIACLLECGGDVRECVHG